MYSKTKEKINFFKHGKICAENCCKEYQTQNGKPQSFIHHSSIALYIIHVFVFKNKMLKKCIWHETVYCLNKITLEIVW
jgi:hypothetical protein